MFIVQGIVGDWEEQKLQTNTPFQDSVYKAVSKNKKTSIDVSGILEKQWNKGISRSWELWWVEVRREGLCTA